MKPTGARGVAYLRVSDASKQDHKSQRQVIQSYLDDAGLNVVGWYEDSGSRHEAYKRPDFLRLLKDVEEGRIDWIVVDIKDRFGTANLWEYGRFICQLRENDTELWSVAQGCISGDDIANSVLSAVDSVRSQDEQINKAVRSVRGAVSGAKDGEWQGGYPPLGYDLVAYSPEGVERWRVYYTGQHQREKRYPDGRSERHDGKGRFPGKDLGDTLRLAPSCDAKRVETVRRIFHWYATEAISLRGICSRLNDLGISPVIGEGWYVTRLTPLLRNPAYLVGQGVYNKNSHGSFREWRDGTYHEVEKVKGKVKTGRKHQQSQFVYPEGEYKGLIDIDTWDRVQAKLKGIKRSASAPKNPGLWLAGLLYCGHCDRRMVGWYNKGEKSYLFSYTCGAYRQYGRKNSAGCRLHRVNAPVIEAVLGRYLRETGEGLEALLTCNADEVVLGRLIAQQEVKQCEFLRLVTRLWREVKAHTVPGQPWSIDSLVKAHQARSGDDRAALSQQLTAKDAEHSRLVEAYADLPGLAKEKAKVKLQALESEMEVLRLKLEPLAPQVQALRQELAALEGRVREARESLAGGNRQKAAAVGRVVRRLVCRFRHEQAGSQDRSVLVEVRVEPVEGADRAFVVSNPPGPIVHCESILARVFSEAEICQIKLES